MSKLCVSNYTLCSIGNTCFLFVIVQIYKLFNKTMQKQQKIVIFVVNCLNFAK